MTIARKTLLLSAFLFLAGGVAAADSGITLRPLNGSLYLVEDDHYTRTNSLIYVGPSFVTVVGATWSPETARLLAEQIKQVTDRPVKEVIDTSPDPEWSGGNAYWTRMGAKVVAASVTCASLRSGWNKTVERARQNFPGYPQLPLSAPAACYPEKFDLQDGNIRVFYIGPTHTPADVFVYFPKEQVLDAGSILKEQPGNLANANLSEYSATLHRLQALHLDIKTIVAGHWSAVHGPELIEKYLGFLRQAQNVR
jgi:metallo-beta-lactamase class B